jgi:hypothetical protein
VIAFWIIASLAPPAAALAAIWIGLAPRDEPDDWWTDTEHSVARSAGHIEVPEAEMRGGAR